MKRQIMLITIISFLLSGCPSTKIETKKPAPDAGSPVSTEQETPKRVAEIVDPRHLTFPVTDNKVTLSSIQTLAIMDLDMPLAYYWKTTGQFPDSIKTWVQSGYPLTWPRDLLRGTPARVVAVDNITPDEETIGSFQYDRIDKDKVEIKYVAYDREKARETGKDEWKISDYVLPEKYDEPFALVNGSKIGFDEIEDPEKRKLYLYCAELGYFLHYHTGVLFVKAKMLPSSFSDLLFANNYIISENFQAFKQLLQSLNADLKYGIDYDKRIHYFYFAMDNETYIFSCIKYGYEQTEIQIMSDDEIEGLNMSSPLLSDENIASLVLPQQYTISIQDIPMGE